MERKQKRSEKVYDEKVQAIEAELKNVFQCKIAFEEFEHLIPLNSVIYFGGQFNPLIEINSIWWEKIQDSKVVKDVMKLVKAKKAKKRNFGNDGFTYTFEMINKSGVEVIVKFSGYMPATCRKVETTRKLSSKEIEHYKKLIETGEEKVTKIICGNGKFKEVLKETSNI